ncbi:MAG: helix-turn-helix transcriptional regulator [Planctomycetota bacterium]
MTTPIPDTGALGALIRAERQAQGLRQPDLAAAAGTSVRFIVEVERGKPTARIGKVFDVLRQLGLELRLSGPGGAALSPPDDDA